MSTLAAIVRDNPLLAGAIFILIAIFVFLMIAITTARRAARPPRPREPRRGGGGRGAGYDADIDRDYGPAVRVGDALDRDYGPPLGGIGLDEPRRGYGFAALMFTFVIGVAVGAALLHFRSQLPVKGTVNTILGLVEASSSTASEPDKSELPPPLKQKKAEAPIPPPRPAVPEAKATTEEPVAADAPAVADAPAATADASAVADVPAATGAPAVADVPATASVPAAAPSRASDVDGRLVKLVTKLGSELPVDVGPEIELTTIRTSDRVVTLGYTVDRAATDDDAKKFQEALTGTVRGIICDGKATEVRYLNDNGIEFYLIFIDQVGKTVGKFAALPKFCGNGEATAATP